MIWIAVIAVLMVAAALICLYFTGPLDATTIIATRLGGHDQNVSDVTGSERKKR